MAPAIGEGAASAAPTATEEKIASALEFAELGCRVVPCDGKNPGGLLGRSWQTKATRNVDEIANWFERWPFANVGVLPDRGCIPVDVDSLTGYGELVENAGEAPPTPMYLTGRDEFRHRLLFAFDGRVLDADRTLAPGVQLRHCTPGSALMCVVPPGTHPETGAPVEWVYAPDELPLAPIPEAWLARVLRPNGKPARPKSEWAAMFARTFVSGCGETHPSFVSMAGRLVPAVGAQATFELLRCWNQRHCRPPKDEREIADAVRWVARKEASR